MPDAIDPSKIPGADIDPDTIEAQAGTIGTIATSVRDNGSNVHLKWQGMAAVYSAPESATLLGLMQPVSSQATTVGDNLDIVSSALAQFASDVRPIKAELDSLRSQAQWFVDTAVANGVQVRELNPAWMSTQGGYGYGYGATAASYPAYGSSTSTTTAEVPQYRYVTKEWHEDQDTVDRNNELLSAVNAQQVALWEAERTCANKIRALYGAQPLHAARSENDALAYGLDEIPEGTEMPWGASVERTEGCGEATANFVFKDFLWEGIVVGGIWGTIEGLGTLVLGYNPATGDWFSGDAYGAAWGNLGMLAAGLVMNSSVVAPLFMADDIAQQLGGEGFLPDEVNDFKDSADEVLLNTGKGLIAWDKWADDPGTALGESVFNVGTLLIPVGGVAVAGVKTATTATSVIARMARIVDFVDPGAWAVNGALRLGGAGLGSLDNLIGRMDLASSLDNFDPGFDTYTAMDAPSALQALDEWGVDLNQVTAHVDDGIPVLEFPGGRIELPAGSFDNAGGVVRTVDGGVDAVTPAPMREPELVSAGGVRGETGQGPVNSIVDETPVRTEPSGSGESTTIREPATESGSGTGHGGSGSDDTGTGHNGSDADGGTGHGESDGGPNGDGDAAANDGSAGDGSGGEDLPGDGVGPRGDGIGDDATGSGPSAVGDDPIAWHSTEDPNLTLTESQVAAVDEFLETSRQAEPGITADMVRIGESHPGVRMEGLDFRLKGDESMYRKVSTALDQLAPGTSADAVTAAMKDSIRYTYVVPDGAYSATVDGIMRDLIERGYEPSGTLKNTWGGDGYQGINSNMVDPASGRIIEVQFHTESSFTAKMDAHESYEQSRLPGQDPDVVARLELEQRDIFGRVDVPEGASTIDWPAADGGDAALDDLAAPGTLHSDVGGGGHHTGVDDQAFFTESLDAHDLTITEANDLRRTPVDELSDAEVVDLRELRESVPPVTPETPMTKVVPLDDVDKYISGEYSQLGGFMTRSADFDGAPRALSDLVDELRLDYDGSPFTRPEADGYAVIDFTAGPDAAFDVPFSPRFGGDHDVPAPFTGNGFTGATRDAMIPELVAQQRFEPTEGALISIVRDGVRTPVAVFTDGTFHRIEGR